MNDTKRSHATITDAKVFFEADREFWTCAIDVDYADSGHQGFGYLVLDEQRAHVFMSEVCAIFGATGAAALVGRNCFALKSLGGFNEAIEGLEVDGKRFTVTGFRRRHYHDAVSGVQRERDRLIGELRWAHRRAREAVEDLATLDTRWTDWETAPVTT